MAKKNKKQLEDELNRYGREYEIAKRKGDRQGMAAAHAKANQTRKQAGWTYDKKRGYTVDGARIVNSKENLTFAKTKTKNTVEAIKQAEQSKPLTKRFTPSVSQSKPKPKPQKKKSQSLSDNSADSNKQCVHAAALSTVCTTSTKTKFDKQRIHTATAITNIANTGYHKQCVSCSAFRVAAGRTGKKAHKRCRTSNQRTCTGKAEMAISAAGRLQTIWNSSTGGCVWIGTRCCWNRRRN